jgi:alkylation response protein AidB-like acyl-CoA dehydrogenase
VTTLAPVQSVLTDELIARCGERAAGYDRENRFFQEDFDELKAAGYLKMAIPREFGGLGMSLAEVCQEQRRLAYRAPATALATNMHLYWTGVAADMRRMGDASLEWVLREAAAGEVFAASASTPCTPARTARRSYTRSCPATRPTTRSRRPGTR